jgi:hypothetical protein
MIPFADNPKYLAALDRESFIRSAAFIDWPERICGLQVRPLTFGQIIRLELLSSPFVSGGMPTPDDVRTALWILSVDYSPRSNWRKLVFHLRLSNVGYGDAVTGIREHIDEAFMDAPPAPKHASGPPYCSQAAHIVDTFADEYGWSIEYVLNVPVKALFQLLKRQMKRVNPKAIVFNPSDSVRAELLRELNGKN